MTDPLSVPCPYCGARIGVRCTAVTYWSVGTPWKPAAKRPHKARIRAAQEKTDE